MREFLVALVFLSAMLWSHYYQDRGREYRYTIASCPYPEREWLCPREQEV